MEIQTKFALARFAHNMRTLFGRHLFVFNRQKAGRTTKKPLAVAVGVADCRWIVAQLHKTKFWKILKAFQMQNLFAQI